RHRLGARHQVVDVGAGVVGVGGAVARLVTSDVDVPEVLGLGHPAEGCLEGRDVLGLPHAATGERDETPGGLGVGEPGLRVAPAVRLSGGVVPPRRGDVAADHRSAVVNGALHLVPGELIVVDVLDSAGV